MCWSFDWRICCVLCTVAKPSVTSPRFGFRNFKCTFFMNTPQCLSQFAQAVISKYQAAKSLSRPSISTTNHHDKCQTCTKEPWHRVALLPTSAKLLRAYNDIAAASNKYPE